MKLGQVVKVIASSYFAYISPVLVMHTFIMIHLHVEFLFGLCLNVFKILIRPVCTCLEKKVP